MNLNLNDAKYLIIGQSSNTAGFLNKADNELLAHRIANKYKKQGYINVKVVENNAEGLEQASQLMVEFLRKRYN